MGDSLTEEEKECALDELKREHRKELVELIATQQRQIDDLFDKHKKEVMEYLEHLNKN